MAFDANSVSHFVKNEERGAAHSSEFNYEEKSQANLTDILINYWPIK